MNALIGKTLGASLVGLCFVFFKLVFRCVEKLLSRIFE
jgi:hypothetical protein